MPAQVATAAAAKVLALGENPDLLDRVCGRCGGFRCGPGQYSAACGMCVKHQLAEAAAEGVDEGDVWVINVDAVVRDVMER